MTNKTYRAGVIGLGMIGGADPISADALGQKVENMDGTHAVTYQKSPRVKLVAGSARDAGRRDRFAARTGAKTYADWREMLDKEALDIVSIATYSPSHAEIAVGCAERGVRVIYCEKPVATTLADAERMLVACRKSNTLLLFNHQRRFEPNHRRLRQLIADGRLGDITSAVLQWSTGRLGNVGTHVLDGLMMVLQSRYVSLSATLDLAGKPDCRGSEFQDPGGWGTLRMANGTVAVVNAPDYSKTGFQTEINGTKGRVWIKGLSVTLELDGKTETWPAIADGRTSMDRALDEIVDYLDRGTPFSCTPDDAVHILEVIIGFHASHAHGSTWLDLPLKGKDREIEVKTG